MHSDSLCAFMDAWDCSPETAQRHAFSALLRFPEWSDILNSITHFAGFVNVAGKNAEKCRFAGIDTDNGG